MNVQCKEYRVTIFGQEYCLKSDDPVEIVSAVAKMVDMSMHEISDKISSKDIQLIAVFTAIKLAHTLHIIESDVKTQLNHQNILTNKIDQTLLMLNSFL